MSLQLNNDSGPPHVKISIIGLVNGPQRLANHVVLSFGAEKSWDDAIREKAVMGVMFKRKGCR